MALQHSLSGILHNSGVPGGPHTRLPLEELTVKAFIVDVSAKVILTQVFANPSDHPTSRAVYCFAVPAGAAVCAFEASLQDGARVVGICKEKDQALQEHEQAISEGKFTGLMEWVTDDVFTFSVGSIPAKATVSVKIQYIMCLMNDDNPDEIRLHLPMHIGDRYGPQSPALDGATQPSSSTRIRITTSIQSYSTLRTVFSPSHGSEVVETRYRTHRGTLSRHRTTVRFKSRNFLAKDFVVVVQAERLDSPRCFAELDETRRNQENGVTLALQLVLIPKFRLPPIPAQEYLFVIDRSGSMAGAPIMTATRTLNMLLRMLPNEGTLFNIYSFGSSHSSLWPSSRIYDQNTLEAASKHVDGMHGDMSGTELMHTLDAVCSNRQPDLPTAVFILTDGEVSNPDETARVVRQAVNSAPASSPLRVHVLGIGDQVSTALCEAVSVAGNGVALFAVTTEMIVTRCARLLRAGRTPFVNNVEVDWGVPSHMLGPSVRFTPHIRSTSSSGSEPDTFAGPSLQQAPASIQSVHAGVRMMVFAIISLRETFVPGEVVLRGTIEGTHEQFSVAVPVREVLLRDANPGMILVHTLAAKYLINEHRIARAAMTSFMSDAAKSSVIRLGTRYQVSSEFTSFVATDPLGTLSSRRRSRISSAASSRPLSFATSVTDPLTVSAPPTMASSDANSSWRASLASLFSMIRFPSYLRDRMPGAWPGSSTDTTPPTSPQAAPDGDSMLEQDGTEQRSATADTMSTLDCSCSDWSGWSLEEEEEETTPEPILSPEEEVLQHGSEPHLFPLKLAPPAVHRRLAPQAVQRPVPRLITPVPAVALDVIRLQKFDGSFELTADLNNLVAQDVTDPTALVSFDTSGLDPGVFATAVAVAFVMKHVKGQNEMLRDLLEKAISFLRVSNAESLVEEVARRIFNHEL